MDKKSYSYKFKKGGKKEKGKRVIYFTWQLKAVVHNTDNVIINVDKERGGGLSVFFSGWCELSICVERSKELFETPVVGTGSFQVNQVTCLLYSLKCYMICPQLPAINHGKPSFRIDYWLTFIIIMTIWLVSGLVVVNDLNQLIKV